MKCLDLDGESPRWCQSLLVASSFGMRSRVFTRPGPTAEMEVRIWCEVFRGDNRPFRWLCPRVREHVVGSDLLLAYPLCASSKHSLPWGGLWREKGQGCAGRNSGYDPISQFEPATLVPKRKTRLARQAPSGS